MTNIRIHSTVETPEVERLKKCFSFNWRSRRTNTVLMRFFRKKSLPGQIYFKTSGLEISSTATIHILSYFQLEFFSHSLDLFLSLSWSLLLSLNSEIFFISNFSNIWFRIACLFLLFCLISDGNHFWQIWIFLWPYWPCFSLFTDHFQAVFKVKLFPALM